MNIFSTQHVAQLEWANYAATLPIAQATPGLEVVLTEEVILTSNVLFPYVDVTHACLLRATPETIDPLLQRVRAYFQAKALPTTIFISPACIPASLTERLEQQGFVRNVDEEAWLTLGPLDQLVLPQPNSRVKVKLIMPSEVSCFVEIMMAAFEMPAELAPNLIQLTEPSVGLPGIYHYLALVDDQPVGTCSLVCYEDIGVLGGVGVVPTYRGSGVATYLVVKTVVEARRQGVQTLLLQTASARPLERLLRMSGFKKIFTRISYTLYE